MLYVILFLAGVAMGASPLIIWYYYYVAAIGERPPATEGRRGSRTASVGRSFAAGQ